MTTKKLSESVVNHQNRKKYRGKLARLLSSLNQVLAKHNRRHAIKGKEVGYATQQARAKTLASVCRLLHELGFSLTDIRKLKNKHVIAMMKHWEKRGCSASTLQNRFSVLRTLCRWLNKASMLGHINEYLENPQSAKRSYIAKEEKTWSIKGVDAGKKILEVIENDTYVALQLLLMILFGLRIQEAAQLRVGMADKRTYLDVRWGTKNNRGRTVPIETQAQRDALVFVKQFANTRTGSTIPEEYSLNEWLQHFYYICRKCDITRKNGIVPHGLRHEYAHEVYESVAGVLTPLKAKSRGEAIQRVVPALDRAARQEVAERLGHARMQISDAYIGRTTR
jgi:integrase